MAGPIATIVCPCHIELGIMTFTFTDHITGQMFDVSLSKEDLMQPVESRNEPLCRVSLMASPMDNWILGDAFLRRAYIVHDLDERRMGIFWRPAPPPEDFRTPSDTFDQ